MNNFAENENNSREDEGFSTVFSAPAEHKNADRKKKKRPIIKIVVGIAAVAVLSAGTAAVMKFIPEKTAENISSNELKMIKVLSENPNNFESVGVKNSKGSFKFFSETVKDDSDSSDSSPAESMDWYVDGYDRELINPSAVLNIVNRAANVEAIKEITQKSADECGLNSPVATVDITKKDGTQITLKVGTNSPDNGGTYIAVSPKNKIYLAESINADSFEFSVTDFAETSSVSGVELTDEMNAYKDENGNLASFDFITLSGTNFPQKTVFQPNNDSGLSGYAPFVITSPTKRIADNTDRLLEMFSGGIVSSGAYSFDVSDKSLADLGLDKPEFRAEIKIGSYSLTYCFKKQPDGDYAVWYDGCKLIKRVSAANISCIDLKQTDYYATSVNIQPLSELSNFTVKTADKTYSFDIAYDESKDQGERYDITLNGKQIKTDYFNNFYRYCNSLSVTDFSAAQVNAENGITLTFNFSDKSKGKAVFKLIKSGETKYQLVVNGMDMGKVSSTSINKLLKYAENVALGKDVS